MPRDAYYQRTDLQLSGRTVMGMDAPRGQERSRLPPCYLLPATYDPPRTTHHVLPTTYCLLLLSLHLYYVFLLTCPLPTIHHSLLPMAPLATAGAVRPPTLPLTLTLTLLQELCDHYMAPLNPVALECMKEMQHECFKMGIPLNTRHREVPQPQPQP